MAAYYIWMDQEKIQELKKERAKENETANEPKSDHALVLADLEDHMQGHNGIPFGADQSPTGKSGVLFTWVSPSEKRVVVDKEKQEWIPSVNGRYHVGVWKDDLPKQADLRREYTQSGTWLKFGSSKWKVPTPGTIDQKLQLQDDGSWQFAPLRQYSWYSDAVSELFSQIELPKKEDGSTDKEENITVFYNFNDLCQLAVQALRINYRVTPEVCSRLEMFSKVSIGGYYQAITGLRVLEDVDDEQA